MSDRIVIGRGVAELWRGGAVWIERADESRRGLFNDLV